MTLSLSLSLFTAPSNQPSSPSVPPPLLPPPGSPPSRVGRAPSCASNNRVETPCGSRLGSHTPRGTSNEQFHYCLTPVINLHEHPPPRRSPPAPTSPPSTPPSSLHPCFSSLLSQPRSFPFFVRRIRANLSFPPPRYTRVSFPSLDLVAPFSSSFPSLDWKKFRLLRKGGGGTETRNVHFCSSRFRLRRSNEEPVFSACFRAKTPPPLTFPPSSHPLHGLKLSGGSEVSVFLVARLSLDASFTSPPHPSHGGIHRVRRR